MSTERCGSALRQGDGISSNRDGMAIAVGIVRFARGTAARRKTTMIEIKRILCPTDFSEFSRHAIEQAIALARWYASEISVLHVYTMPVTMATFSGDGTAFPIDRSALTGSYREEFAAEMRRLIATLEPGDVPLETSVLEGGVIDTVIGEARRLPADLIVMGTHGRSGFERLLLGSVSERVVRKAPCPVLTVPRRVSDIPFTFKRILCPIDFSAASLDALRYALSLAQEADGRLIVVHVLEMMPAVATTDDFVLNVPEFRARYERDARERLRLAIPAAVRDYCRISEAVVTGKAYEAILDLAAKNGAELIVMGVQGRGAADLMLFGSTTQHVMRQATCPVLTIRALPVQSAEKPVAQSKVAGGVLVGATRY